MTAQEVREHASRWLPDYMIPSTYVQLSSLPLSSNGKVDRDLLPPPSERNTLSVPMFQEGSTEIESIILSLVRSLLHNKNIGLDDDFFMVGGHSLLGTQLVLRAREAFGVKLTLRDLFEASTVVRLAARIDALILDDVNALTEEEALRLGSDGDA